MRTRTLLVVLLLAAELGCASQPAPATPCGSARVEVTITTPPDDSEVDLLIVLDGSPSMTAFAPDVVTALRGLIRELASGDRNADGILDFTPAHSLHIAVIDPDMGTGAASGAPACDAGPGDDGRLLTRGTGASGCAADYATTHPGGVFAFTAGRDDPDALATDVGCVLGAIRSDCAYDRAVDAILAALDTGRDTGFLSPEALLAIFVLTAQDECSTTQPEIFSDAAPFGGVAPGLRCDAFTDQLRPTDDVASKLLALRARPELLLLGIASGVPAALAGMDPAVILAAPALDPHADATQPDRLAPACTRGSDGAIAFPAARWARIAQALNAVGAATTLQSICNAPSIDALADGGIYGDGVGHIEGLCLPRPIATDADGVAPCELTMTLPAIGTSREPEHCRDLDHAEAYTLDHVVSLVDPIDGTPRSREVCRVRQVGRAGAGIDAGWAYDDGSPALMPGWSSLGLGCAQRAGLSVIGWGHGVDVRIVCDERILPASGAAAQLGSPCDPATGMTVTSPPVPCSTAHVVNDDATSGALTCDAFGRSCQLACATDADCPGGGAIGMVCDLRSAIEYFPDGVPGGVAPSDVRHVCVDPSCRR